MSTRLIASTSSRISIFSSARRHAIIPQWSRNLHARRPLSYPVEGGLGDFLPPPALKTLAVDYQEGLLQRLTDEVRGKFVSALETLAVLSCTRHWLNMNIAGTEEESKSVAQTVIDTAADRTKALAFNYASEALNNSFFLDFLVSRHAPAVFSQILNKYFNTETTPASPRHQP